MEYTPQYVTMYLEITKESKLNRNAWQDSVLLGMTLDRTERFLYDERRLPQR